MGGKYLSMCFRKAILYECALMASGALWVLPFLSGQRFRGQALQCSLPTFFFLSLFVGEGFYKVVGKCDP